DRGCVHRASSDELNSKSLDMRDGAGIESDVAGVGKAQCGGNVRTRANCRLSGSRSYKVVVGKGDSPEGDVAQTVCHDELCLLRNDHHIGIWIFARRSQIREGPRGFRRIAGTVIRAAIEIPLLWTIKIFPCVID